jgi:hypothetical protein
VKEDGEDLGGLGGQCGEVDGSGRGFEERRLLGDGAVNVALVRVMAVVVVRLGGVVLASAKAVEE